MGQIEIIDNAFSVKQFKKMSDLALGDQLPWYFNDWVVSDKNEKMYDCQFTHVLFRNNNWYSNFLKCFSPVFDFLNAKQLLKVKLNSTMWADSLVEHGLHIDVWEENAFTAILYLNTNDGYTKFENGPKVESVANRLVIFPSQINHTGTNCTDAKRRVVLNVNYLP